MTTYIQKEVEKGHILGPQSISPPIHSKRFGVISKRHSNPTKFRLIMDLSHSERASINNGIDPALCLKAYISIGKVAAQAACLGRGPCLRRTQH